MNDRFDPLQAAAETRLDRVDQDAYLDEEPAAPAPSPTEPPVTDGTDPDGYGFHLDDPDDDLLDEDLDAGLRDDTEADALDAVAEAYNARDLDRLLEVVARDGEAPGILGQDRDNLPAGIEDLWQRRPTSCLTRGHAGTEHVGVLWEHDGAEWWRVAVVHVDDIDPRDGRIGVLEFSDDPDLLEQVVCEAPDGDLEEGARWQEWDEGASD